MLKKKFDNFDSVKTANDAIKFAEERGAKISGVGVHTKIKVPGKGAVIINQNEGNLQDRTRVNLRKWFKLLGLMILLLAFTYNLWWPALRNFLWVLQNS